MFNNISYLDVVQYDNTMGQEEEDDEELAPAANNEAFRREYARNINSQKEW